ncbi:MAG: glycosyltransferase involved in cell wall biosynthesis [Flavobacteriales bacterium]|jgi:glycosyltransferase involved in cell wall biosynthesis
MNQIKDFNKSEVLIILPAYNEGQIIHKVLESIKSEGYYNICVVDDGSNDQTAKEVLKSNVQLLQHPINRGAGAAVQTGIAFAKKRSFEYAILMDSDGQHMPEDIEELYLKMQDSNADIVIGNRFSLKKNVVPRHRIAYNRMANIFTNIFCKRSYNDTQSGFRLLNRKSIEMIQLKNRGFGFCSEMLIFAEKANLRVEETPIQVLYTDYSLNKGQNLMEGVRTARSILWQVFFE